MTVLVLGSINMDLVVEVPHLPVAGETVIGNRFFQAFGGKGANVAVAVAKLGFPVSLVGQVGQDEFGRSLLAGLQAVGVNTAGIFPNPQTHSGVALIVITPEGQNAIACAAGANGLVGTREIQHFSACLGSSRVVVLELGIPLTTVCLAIRAAHQAGVTVILDPAPATASLPADIYPMVDIITPNEIEASQLVGFSVHNLATAAQAAEILGERGVKQVIITLGSQGSWCHTATESFAVPAIPVPAIDTVAAGDAYNGALAAALAKGKPFLEAVQWGTVAGALAVTQKGAQPSLPDWPTFSQLLWQQVSASEGNYS